MTEYQRALIALRLEVPAAVADDVTGIVEAEVARLRAALAAAEERAREAERRESEARKWATEQQNRWRSAEAAISEARDAAIEEAAALCDSSADSNVAIVGGKRYLPQYGERGIGSRIRDLAAPSQKVTPPAPPSSPADPALRVTDSVDGACGLCGGLRKYEVRGLDGRLRSWVCDECRGSPSGGKAP